MKTKNFRGWTYKKSIRRKPLIVKLLGKCAAINLYLTCRVRNISNTFPRVDSGLGNNCKLKINGNLSL